MVPLPMTWACSMLKLSSPARSAAAKALTQLEAAAGSLGCAVRPKHAGHTPHLSVL